MDDDVQEKPGLGRRLKKAAALQPLVNHEEDDVPRPHAGEGRDEAFVESGESFCSHRVEATFDSRGVVRGGEVGALLLRYHVLDHHSGPDHIHGITGGAGGESSHHTGQ